MIDLRLLHQLSDDEFKEAMLQVASFTDVCCKHLKVVKHAAAEEKDNIGRFRVLTAALQASFELADIQDCDQLRMVFVLSIMWHLSQLAKLQGGIQRHASSN